jgi:hypothetical protein
MDIVRREMAPEIDDAAAATAAEQVAVVLANVRARVFAVVGKYPRTSLVGAFALGFLLARAIRRASRRWS